MRSSLRRLITDPMSISASSVFRFAPSPNGYLHLGHARSALLVWSMARASGGRFLVRLEDIDPARCMPAYETAILDDLARLGLTSDAPIRRQSDHFSQYGQALERLKELGLAYPSFLSRTDIRAHAARYLAETGLTWPVDPDGAPLAPGHERDLDRDAALARIAAGGQVVWRLDMARAIDLVGPLDWQDSGAPPGDPSADAIDRAAMEGRRVYRTVRADPALWGDVILARADSPTSYHVAVVVDDAAQGISDVVRGADLFQATSVHRVLQTLLGLPVPRYHHHGLVRDATGRKLAKSDGDARLAVLLDRGLDTRAILQIVGLG